MNPYALIPLLSIVVYAVLIFLTMNHAGSRKERRAFTLYLTAAGIYSAISLPLLLDYSFLKPYTLIGSRVLILSIIWEVVTYYYFVRMFVQKPAGLGIHIGNGFFLLIAVLAAMGLVPRDAYSEGGKLYLDHGPGVYLMAAFTVGMVSASFYFLVQHLKQASSSVARTRITYLLIGLTVVSIATTVNVIGDIGKYPTGNLGNLANALIISYAILKYRLLDIRVVLRRGIAYSTISIVLTATYLMALYFIYSLSQLTLQTSIVPAAILALIMALVFIPLRNFTQDRVDRIFYRHTYAYRTTLLDFSRRAASIIGLDKLSREMVHVITTALQARWGALLVPDTVASEFRVEDVEWLTEDDKPLNLTIRQDSPLVSYMIKEEKLFRREMLDVLPQAKGLWESEYEELRTLEVSLLCPVLTRGQLTSIIALGPKKNGGEYNDEEAELLLAMASGAAVAMENSRTLESLRRREEANERLLSRVVSAQEEERQRVAADLHDSVAQWLIRASYQAQIASALIPENQSNGVRKEIGDIESTIDASVKELRRVLAGLRPPALEELGLPHALEKEVDGLKAEGIAGTLEVIGDPVRLSPPVEIATYRLVQEALNNVRRHSKATSVRVQLNFNGEQLIIRVSDNGVGFDVARSLSGAGSTGHLGILGMKQRAESLGGELRVDSRKGNGTRIVFQLPLNS